MVLVTQLTVPLHMLVTGVLSTFSITSVSVLVSNLSQVDKYIDLTCHFFCRQLRYLGYKRCKFAGRFMGFLKSICTIVETETKAKF